MRHGLVREVIRRYRPADEAGVLDVWLSASRIAHPFLPDAFFEREREEIRTRYLPAVETWVFEDGGRIVGFVALIGDEVGGLFVLPERQRQGIGGRLLDHLQASRDLLELEVFEANAIGRAFYDKRGFEVVRRGVHEATGRATLRMRLDRSGRGRGGRP